MFEEPHRNLAKAVRCPKCRGRNLSFEERTPGSVTLYSQSYTRGSYTIVTGQQDAQVTADSNVKATCEACQHVWTVRGVRRVAELTYAQPQLPAPETTPAGAVALTERT